MNKKRRSVPGIRHYDGPAGGWGALKATAIAVRTQMDTLDAPATLLRTNQPDGFDCPGCAWPDKEHKSTFQFCENGAKAVTWEATNKPVTTDFLAKNSVSSLLAKSDFELEGYGRLTHPLRYDRASDTFQPVEWDDAFQRIGEVLRGLEPDQVEFIPPAEPRTKQRICSSCSPASTVPITSPTARICAMKPPASVYPVPLVSGKGPSHLMTSIKQSWLSPLVITLVPTIRG